MFFTLKQMSHEKTCRIPSRIALLRPKNKIKICVRVTPHIYQQLEEVARVNGVSVSVVARAFLLHGVEEAALDTEDEKQM